jgi:two-component system response regulator ResD
MTTNSYLPFSAPLNAVRILAADGDLSVREIIRLAAGEQRWACDEAADGVAALKLLRRGSYHVAALDAELPDIDGVFICRHLRKTVQTPVIILSRNGAEQSRLAAFEAGGNDYVLKPFYPRELVARIRSLLALTGHGTNAARGIDAGKLRVDTQSRTASLEGRSLQLTPKEYELLLFFCRHPFHAFSRDTLLDEVWGQDFFGSDRTVDTHVKSLRCKLQPYGYIETVWGFGYKFKY